MSRSTGGCGDSLRHEARRRAGGGGRFRRLHRQTHQRPQPAGAARPFLARWVLMPEEITILAVDDQPQNLRLLEAVLAPRGYRLVTASSGEQAMEQLSQADPDLVLLDIVMPGIDGYEVCRRIRNNPGTAYL